ncbi:MAG: phage tail tape measure protein [Desulfobacterales bacterium]|nr:phage tail tape measure protein [Desulfobacterales bacterium]
MSKWSVLVELIGKSDRLMRELGTSEKGVRRFGAAVRSEFDTLKRGAFSLKGQLAGLGISMGGVAFLRQTAAMDKRLVQIGQTAGTGKTMVASLRSELYAMGKQSGQDIDKLTDGFDNLIQSGQSWRASLESIKAINKASTITGAGGDVLAAGLTVSSAAFDIDLEEAGKAQELLDKMIMGGRQGKAELENLAAIVSRVGVNAASAGFGFDKMLAFIEALSLVEQSPERLATLADSTIRLFTNLRYMQKAQKATRVKFFDAQGERRDAISVLRDIKKEYDKLTTEQKRAKFIQRAFGEMDLDTIKGLRTLLGGSSLSKVEEFAANIAAAAGTINRDLPDATDNLIVQGGRFKTTLAEAADGFVKPMRDTLAEWIKRTLDSKENGGLGVSGKQLILGSTAAAITAYYGGRLAKFGLSTLLPGAGSVAASVVAGQALEEVSGVQSVFVVNWPNGGGIAGAGGDAAVFATENTLKKLVAVTSAGAVGYGIGTLLSKAGGWMADKASGGKYGEGWMGEMVYDLTHTDDGRWRALALAQDMFGNEKQPITINMPVTIDPSTGRVTAETDSMGAVVRPSLERGGF